MIKSEPKEKEPARCVTKPVLKQTKHYLIPFPQPHNNAKRKKE